MARFTATFTNTEALDWEAGDFVRFDKFRDQIGQNIEYLAQTHDHNGNPGDGGLIQTSDPKFIWFISDAKGAPFA